MKIPTPDRNEPDVPRLLRWLGEWVQPSGAIHGYHNHAVWGDHPWRYADRWCGHSTFSAPLLCAWAQALVKVPDVEQLGRLEQMVRWQCAARQPDGQFDHVGYQVGERLRGGLIHNMVPALALVETWALVGKHWSAGLGDTIDRTVREVLEICGALHGGEVTERSTANQDYARTWVRLRHMAVFEHKEWDERVQVDLDRLMARFHQPGLPDAQSVGVSRSTGPGDLIEPAEYYGLMITPLQVAASRYQREDYAAAALGLARHVARSAWTDDRGRRRLHRLWRRWNGDWVASREPMLIAGAGLTLAAIAEVAAAQGDAELGAFGDALLATYAASQTDRGFFQMASGWGGEQDLIPSVAWHTHDAWYLTRCTALPADLWSRVATPCDRVSVVLGDRQCWVENRTHWGLHGYEAMNGFELVGRKDGARFRLDLADWIEPPDAELRALRMKDRPLFMRTDEAVMQLSGPADLDVWCVTKAALVAGRGG